MRYFSLLFCIMTICFVSCVRELTLDPSEEPMVVVDCVLIDESSQTLRLFYSMPPSYSDMTPITEAEVELFDKTEGKSAGLFAYKEGKEWSLDYTAMPEHKYRLEVRIPGHDLIYAEDTMPTSAGIDYKIWNLGLTPSSVIPKLNEDCEYGAGFYGTTYRILSPYQYLWIYAMNYNYQTGYRYIADEICTNCPLVNNFNLTGTSYEPVLFNHTLSLVTSQAFDSELYPQLKGESIHRRFLRIHKHENDERTTDGWFLVSGSLEGINSLSCMSVSESYDVYLRDAIKLQQMQGTREITELYLRDNIYTNIVGGLGIFGAMTIKKLPWIQGWDYESLEII